MLQFTQMSTETFKTNNETYTPLESPEILGTEKEGVLLEETGFDDPELKALAEQNPMAINQGEINIDLINGLQTRKDGRAFKITAGEQGAVAGAIYGITRGKDHGTMELVYYMDQDFEGQGIMGASVRAIASEYGKKYDLMFDIGDTNEHSAKIARSVGAQALGSTGVATQFFTDRRRQR